MPVVPASSAGTFPVSFRAVTDAVRGCPLVSSERMDLRRPARLDGNVYLREKEY